MLDVFSYSGYPFIPLCVAIAVGLVMPTSVYFAALMYGALCSAVVLLRTLKARVAESRSHAAYGHLASAVPGGGADAMPKSATPLLIALCAIQFPVALFLGKHA